MAASYLGGEYVFVRGVDNGIYFNRFDGSTWTGWGAVPGGGGTTDAPAAVVHFGVLHVFVRGTDDRIYQNRFDGSTWSGWGEVCCDGFTPSAPAAASYNGELHVFVRGTDNRIYQNRFNPFTGTWSRWGEVCCDGFTPSAPAATVFNNGSANVLQLVVRGTDDRVYQTQFNPFSNTWSGWGEIPGGGSTPSGPDVAVSGSTVDVAVRGFDDQLYVNRFDGATWSGWILIPAMAIVADDPGLNLFNGTFSAFVRAADNTIFKVMALPDTAVDAAGASSIAVAREATTAAAAAFRITCFPKALVPVHAVTEVEGSARTNCTAGMAALGVHAALWRAVPAQIGGRRGFWSLADHSFNVTVASSTVLQRVSAPCNPRMVGRNAYVITALHTMTPPPGFRPPHATTITNSGVAQLTC